MDKTKKFLDLSKCTEEERKSLPQIIKNGGDEVPFQMAGDFYNKDFPYLCFLAHLNYPIWDCCRNAFDLTELTYPEFIKLFEGGEGETSFKNYIENQRKEFARFVSENYTVDKHLQLRTQIDSLLIAYDQMHNKLNSNQ